MAKWTVLLVKLLGTALAVGGGVYGTSHNMWGSLLSGVCAAVALLIKSPVGS